MAITFLHSASDVENRGTYYGETWAESDCEDVGHIKWHADGHTVFVDYIETNGRVPLLSVRLLKVLLDAEKQNLDPGVMNDAGKRLWRLFRARYSYA